MKNFILFDIGANWGNDSLPRTKLDIGAEAWAFEPIPEMCKHLRSESKEFSNRYHIEESAISNYDGTATFNVQELPNSDWGCSSLHTFNDNLDISWPDRKDFVFSRTITVWVSRLDTWFKRSNTKLDRIDFFHCDAQGNDLKVLQGMGEFLPLIRAGSIECAANREEAKLYKEGHTVEEAWQFLLDNGFIVTEAVSNDRTNNEYNLFFKRLKD